MLKKRNGSALAVLLIIISLTVAITACDNSPWLQTRTQITEVPNHLPYQAMKNNKDPKVTEKKDTYPGSTSLINQVTQTGYSSYTGYFTAVPEYGKTLKVWVSNTGKYPFYMDIKRNGQLFVSDIQINPGKEKIQTFKEHIAEGITGDWEVYVYTKIGGYSEINVDAKQIRELDS